MNTKLIAISALLVIASAAMAQVSGRSFLYKGTDLMDQDFSTVGDFALKVRTRVTVNPYLYVKGNLGAEWIVDGWGTGVDSKTESIRFFHNETLTLDLEEFSNPQKVSGTKTGAQEITLEAELAFFNDQTKKQVFTSGLVLAKALNTAFQPSGPNFGVDFTGGLMRMDLNRKVTINPNVGPGIYENVGVVKVIRN